MRSAVWFVVAGLIAVAGFAGAVIYLMPRLAAADAGTMRVVVPGNALLVFDKPGPYMIYHEKKSTVDGRYYASDNVDGLSLGLTADATGAQVKLVEPKTTHELRRSAIAAAARSTPSRSTSPAATGWRRTWRAAAAMPRRCWRSGRAWSARCSRTIFGAIAISFAGLGIAAAIVFTVLWQRSKAVRRLAPE